MIVASAALIVTCGAAFAQTKDATKSRSAVSMECSKQADEKGLHGKARKRFRSKCIKDMKKKAGQNGTIPDARLT
jgi:hypothetical protein